MHVVQMLTVTRAENGIVPDEQIKDLIIQDFSNKHTISSPCYRARKGIMESYFKIEARVLKSTHVIA
jgi:hypothetical protein